MTTLKKLRLALAPLALTLLVGCAPAYHCYSGCHVNCEYCPPPPLAHTQYAGCVCHSPAVAKYLNVRIEPKIQTDGGDDRHVRSE